MPSRFMNIWATHALRVWKNINFLWRIYFFRNFWAHRNLWGSTGLFTSCLKNKKNIKNVIFWETFRRAQRARKCVPCHTIIKIWILLIKQMLFHTLSACVAQKLAELGSSENWRKIEKFAFLIFFKKLLFFEEIQQFHFFFNFQKSLAQRVFELHMR